MPTIELLLTHGIIHTMDPAHPRASTVAIRAGRVVAVGGAELLEMAGPGSRTVDLEGHCVLPGLIDSHLHLVGYALGLQQLDLSGVRSLAELQQRVAARVAQTPPGQWIQGGGWNQEQWPERRFPTAADLDRSTTDHPVVLMAKSGHALVANSPALQRAGVTAATPDPPGGRIVRDDAGQPSGLLLEEAIPLMRQVMPRWSAAEIATILPTAFAQAWQVGLTAVHDMAGSVEEEPEILDAYLRLREAGWDGRPEHGGELGLRIVHYLPIAALDRVAELPIRVLPGDDWLRVGGIKAFADGALGPRTAMMLDPYIGEPDNRGIATLERHVLDELVRRAMALGLPMAVHAIGDGANRMVLDVFERARESSPREKALRQRIEHVQLIHPTDQRRLAGLGMVASMQPIHAPQDAAMADRYWGERTAMAYAWRSLLDAGASLAFGSDCPVESLNPFLGIHAAVTRAPVNGTRASGWRTEQCLSVTEALRAYTWGAAYAAGLEERLGSLAAGKWADLIVLDRDILAVEPAEIRETRVLRTMVGGQWVIG